MSAPAGSARGGWRHVGAPLVATLFVATLGGAGLFDAMAPAPGPALIQADRLAREREAALDSPWDGSWMRHVDRDLQERSNLRAALVPWYIACVLLPLREGGSGVLIGDEGWMFLEERIIPPFGGHAPGNAMLTANLLTAYDRRLAALGIDSVLLPIPRKGTVVPRFLPAGADLRPDLDRTILRTLERRRVPHVNSFEAWRGLGGVDLWQRWDTHWSGLARWRAYEACMRELGRWVDPRQRVTGVAPDQVEVDDSMLLATLGIPPEHPVHALLPRDRLASPAVRKWTLERLGDGPPGVVVVGSSFSPMEVTRRVVAHLTNAPVRTHAQGGRKSVEMLLERLQDGSIPPGTALVFELPIYQALPLRNGPIGRGRLNTELLSPLAQVEPPRWSALPLRFEPMPQRSTRLAAGRLATSGDAVVHVELGGRPAGAPGLQVSLVAGGYEQFVPWPVGQPRLHLPVLGSGVGSGPLQVLVRGAPDGHGIEPRLVTELDLEAAVELPETKPSAGAGGWTQRRAVPAGLLGSRHAAAWIELDPSGPSGVLEVELLAAGGGAPLRVAQVSLDAGGSALLRISAPEGAAERGSVLRLSGQGPPPRRVGRVRIADLPAR